MHNFMACDEGSWPRWHGNSTDLRGTSCPTHGSSLRTMEVASVLRRDSPWKFMAMPWSFKVRNDRACGWPWRSSWCAMIDPRPVTEEFKTYDECLWQCHGRSRYAITDPWKLMTRPWQRHRPSWYAIHNIFMADPWLAMEQFIVRDHRPMTGHGVP